MADLSLFRHVPMILKERIYNDGNWLFSDTTADGSSPYPDPVIREWIQHIKVVDGPPRYKWYHFIGTHIPAQWDEQCRFLRDMEHTRDNYKKQTLCVLNGIANFLAKLKEIGIYDQTAMVITGDHGCNIPPFDLKGSPKNGLLSSGTIGTARPALLVKQLDNHEPLQFNKAPSSMIDVAPTALALVGLHSDFEGKPAFALAPSERRKRVFRRYVSRLFWTGKPVPYDEYEVNGSPNQAENWQLTAMFQPQEAPGAYQSISEKILKEFIRGASLASGSSNQGQAWIRSNELAFLIRPDKLLAHHTLILKLHIPKYIGEQTVQLVINGHVAANEIRLASKADFWQQLEIPVPGEMLIAGNNFLRLHFENVASPPGHGSFKTSGLIGAIALR
ncbi:sulfatase-like hydrolase/transferase [Candidatus Entotheonella palauensis]|nr:sulfatase-like hydrolase/transferase [Candidatus Entotheonella palauensis]